MGGVRLGTIFDIEVRLDYSWFLVYFLIAWSLATGLFPMLGFTGAWGWGLGLVASLLLFVSVLVHEFSHALMARRYGIEVAGITLFLFGGVAQIKGEPPSPKAEFVIAGVGPVTSVVIGVLCSVVWWAVSSLNLWPPLGALFGYLAFINILLAIFNLIPGFPLDGGRLLRSAIWHFTGNLRRATRYASYAGRAFAWLLIAFGIWQVFSGNLGGLWLAFVGWYLNNAAQAAYQQLLLQRALSGVVVAEVMNTETPTVDAALSVDEFVREYLLRHDAQVYPVCRDGEFAGVITLEDVRALDREEWPTTSVATLAHAPEKEKVVRENQDAWEALTQMLESGASRLLVLRDGRLRGIVSRDAIVRLVQRKMGLGLPV